MENLADSYTQEALSTVLTGSETSLQWSDDNAQRLQELGTLYQEAMADYEAGSTEAGALVETYIEEARALAEAQYDSSGGGGGGEGPGFLHQRKHGGAAGLARQL